MWGGTATLVAMFFSRTVLGWVTSWQTKLQIHKIPRAGYKTHVSKSSKVKIQQTCLKPPTCTGSQNLRSQAAHSCSLSTTDFFVNTLGYIWKQVKTKRISKSNYCRSLEHIMSLFCVIFWNKFENRSGFFWKVRISESVGNNCLHTNWDNQMNNTNLRFLQL